jgi:adenosylmethionine---8-amino-7-oxononanoate aminotransferase
MQAHVVASPDVRQARSGESAADVAQRALQAMRTLLQQRQGRVAAVIVEPLVQCAAGMAMHDASYLVGLRTLCDEFEVHLIADEIAVGCGRSGSFFAFEQATLPGQAPCWPDFILLSKGITGGTMALSVVLTRDAIYQAFWDDRTPHTTARSFLHSHSYSGNPLACRAAWAVLERFERETVLSQNQARSHLINAAWQALRDDARLSHVRQQGMIWAVDVKPEVAGAQFAERFALAARQHELLIRPIGRTIYLMPPYLLPPEQYAWLVQQIRTTLEEVVHAA